MCVEHGVNLQHYLEFEQNKKRGSKKGFAAYASCDAATSSDIHLSLTMNCCQSCGPDLLLSNDLLMVMLSFYKSVLGVRTSVPTSCLLDEVGAVPLQSYWLGAC
jgi:hypothetical protein